MTRFRIAAAVAALAAASASAQTITFKKTVIDKAFRSEGSAVADVNKDGKLDILVGDFWYEAPDWKAHEIRKPGNFGDGSKGYSQSFMCGADDFNGDGWADLLVVGFPGAPCHWYENPQNKPGHWKQHEVWHSACNETPMYVDLFGDGKKVLLMAFQPPKQNNQGQMAWFEPGADPNATWTMHAVSEPSAPGKEIPSTQRFSHGLGSGDVNGDGRNDVIVPQGWWEQPAEGRKATAPWVFHKVGLGAGCADMFAIDIDGDGKNDVVSSSAHGRGIWWHKHNADGSFKAGNILLDTFTQTHAMHHLDINGDGKKDLITGKRWWAHGPNGDKDGKDPKEPNTAAVLYWIEIQAGNPPKFVPHQIDDDSGIGTQFVVQDFNGDNLLDIVVSNKKGVFLLIQERK